MRTTNPTAEAADNLYRKYPQATLQGTSHMIELNVIQSELKRRVFFYPIILSAGASKENMLEWLDSCLLECDLKDSWRKHTEERVFFASSFGPFPLYLNQVDYLEKHMGETLPFYGVDGLFFKWGDKILEAIEDESDGYRSYLDTIVAHEKDVVDKKLVFFKDPIAFLKLQYGDLRDDTKYPYSRDEPGDFYNFVDQNGHVWLYIGTDRSDSYYPSFTFEYNPPRPNEAPKRPDDSLGLYYDTKSNFEVS